MFAVGMVGLGILAIIYDDFALVWQPVPEWVPGRAELAYASGIVMVLGGLGLLFERTYALSVRLLFPYLVIWALLKVPPLVAAPLKEISWLGLGELAVLLTGGWVLFARLPGEVGKSKLAFLAGNNGIRSAQIIFGVALLPLGLSHIVYVGDTAQLVPAWLPFRTGWAYLTGAGHIAAGIGVLFAILPRLAATLEAGMLGVFTLLVWVPAILAAPTTRLSWTAFFVSWSITAAAWLVAGSFGTLTPDRKEPGQNA